MVVSSHMSLPEVESLCHTPELSEERKILVSLCHVEVAADGDNL